MTLMEVSDVDWQVLGVLLFLGYKTHLVLHRYMHCKHVGQPYYGQDLIRDWDGMQTQLRANEHYA